MSEQKCAICGTPFEAYRNRKYCSKECAVRAAEETRIRQLRERGGRTLGDIIICPTCGKNFLYSSSRKRYCSVECQKKAQKTRIDEAIPVQAASRKITQGDTVRPKKKRAKTMSEIAKAAREEHLSYGEYVVKYGL